MLKIAVALILLFITYSSAYSQIIQISGQSPKMEISVLAEDASTADVLMAIAEKYQFKISGIEKLFSDKKFSAEFKGNLPTILQRLLRNNNHLIVSSSKTISGIERIVILEEGSKNQNRGEDENSSSFSVPQFTKSPQQ